MKKELKLFISRVLTAAMLVTSSCTGVVFAQTPDSAVALADDGTSTTSPQSITYDFNDAQTDRVVPGLVNGNGDKNDDTASSYAYYTNVARYGRFTDEALTKGAETAKNTFSSNYFKTNTIGKGVADADAGGSVASDTAPVSGAIHAYVKEENGNKYIRLLDDSADNAELYFKTATISSGEATFSAKIRGEKLGNKMSLFAVMDDKGAEIVRLFTLSNKFGFARGNVEESLGTTNNTVAYEVGKWFNVSITINFDNKTFTGIIKNDQGVEKVKLENVSLAPKEGSLTSLTATAVRCRTSAATNRIINLDDVSVVVDSTVGADPLKSDTAYTWDPDETKVDDDVTTSDSSVSTEATTAGSEDTTSGTEATTAGTEATTAGTENTTSGTENTTSGTENTTSGTENTTSGTENTTSGTENTTSGTEETTSGSQGGGSVSKDYPTTGTGNVATDTAAEVYATATATYQNGKINLKGTTTGKLFVNFPSPVKKGVVTFSGKMDIKALPTGEYPLMEVYGTLTGSTESTDVLAIIVDDKGNLGLRNKASGSRVNVTSTVARPTTAATYKIEVDLDKDIVKAYVDNTLIATDTATGVNLAADVEKIESLDKASFFAKGEYDSDISELHLDVAEASEDSTESTTSGTENTTSGSEESTEGTTSSDVTAQGALKAEAKGVGAAADKDNFAVDDVVEITYSIDEVTGINNYTFYIDFDPTKLEYVSASNADAATSVTYPFGGRDLYLIPADKIAAQAEYAPEAGDEDFIGAQFEGVDGTKKAKELGRIKVADVTGLAGDSSISIATTKAGVLFKIQFKVKEAGSPVVKLTPVTNDLFYLTPESGSTGTPIKFKEDTASNVAVPAVEEVELKDFSVTAEGVTIAVENKQPKVTPASLVEFTQGADGNVITISGNVPLTVAQLIAAMNGATVTGEAAATTTVAASGDTITITQEGADPLTFKVVKGEPSKPQMPEFTLTVGDTGIVVKSNGDDTYTVTGDATLTDDNEIVISKDSTLTPEDVLEAFKAYETGTKPQGVKDVKVEGDEVTITGSNDKKVTFKVTKESDTPAGDVKLTVGGVEIGLAKGTTGLTATVAKGKVLEVEGGAIVPLVGSTKTLGELAEADITIEGATVKSYDAATKTVNVTIGDADYAVKLFVYGDINADGEIGASDALLAINRSNNKLPNATQIQLIAADVNIDNEIGASDALLIINRSNNKQGPFLPEQ